MNTNGMDEYICAFVDVLGARGKGIDICFAKRLDELLSFYKENIDGTQIVMRPISDGLVIGMKITNSIIVTLSNFLPYITMLSQKVLLETESLLRGGISHGKLYVGKHLVF